MEGTTLFHYINSNLDRIKREVAGGLMPCSVLKHYSIYARYDYYLKCGYSVSEAVIFTGSDLKVCESWVFQIIKKMEANYESSDPVKD